MRNKFVYSCSIKICVSGFDKFLESIFCILLVMEAFFSAKSCQGAWRHLLPTSLTWWEVRWIWQMRQNSAAQFVQLLKQWLCNVPSGIVMKKNWALSVDQCWLQVLQFSVYLTDVLSILLKCNAFSWILKAVVDQTASRPPNNDLGIFIFWCKLGCGKCFGASSQSNSWTGHHWLSYKI